MREFSVPPIVTVSDTANLTDPVWDNAESPRTPSSSPGATPSGGWAEVTCRQFRDEVRAVARGLIAAGIDAGDRVGLMSRTRYEWTLLDYAIWAAGAVTVPIYETSSAEQIRLDPRRLRRGRRRGGDRRRTPPWSPAFRDRPARAAPRLADRAGRGSARADRTGLRRRTGRRCRGRSAAARAAVADDLATIIYTSGTTGRPKGCVLTHRNIYPDIANAAPVLPNLFAPGASTLLFLPLAHAFARLIQIGVRAGAGHHGALRRHQEPGRRAAGVPAHLRALRAPGLREGLQRRPAAGRRRRRGAIFDRAEQVAIAYSEALDTPRRARAWRCAPSHGLFDRLVYRKLRAALGGRCRDAISGGAPLGARLGHFFRGVGRHRLRGLRADRDLARRRREPAQRHPDRHRRPPAARRHRPDRATTARS